jgi:hypothetical protein
MNGTSPLGLLSFLSFAFSIIAAVLAIDSYRLLRTGDFGKTWRLLIIASVMFALLQVLRMAEILNVRAIEEGHLAQIVELCFVMVLTYAFYLQRKVFSYEHKNTRDAEEEAGPSKYVPEETLDYPLADGPDEPSAEPAAPSQWPSVSSLDARHTPTP